MSEGERRHDAAHAATLGVAAGAAEAGNAATLPGGHGAPPQLPTVGATVDSVAPRAIDGLEETMAGPSGAGDRDAGAGHAATLAGPGVAADLPGLPRVESACYAIGPELARGGMGKILSARDRRLRRDVVIKVTRHDGAYVDPRFEREALITARLQHPSIVRVYEAGVLGDGRAFYAMERVRGRSLEVVLEGTSSLPQRLALLPHAIAVADAIAYAHSEGVLHRDLKPSNVLIGPFGETVVIDWGLAKDLRAADPGSSLPPRAPTAPSVADSGAGASGSSSLTVDGSVLGTPSYMAPEQARGEPADERSDIYALGALLYTLLTGVPPARGRTTEEVLEDVASGVRVPIAQREPALPPELATIVEHAMAHAPADRYQDAKLLADELRQFAAGKLVASHSYSPWRLVRRWLWRHRITVGVAAFALVVLAVVGALAVREVVEERTIAQHAQIEAETQKALAQRQYSALLVDLARGELATDPSHAIAWLKLLEPAALAWPSTLQIAEEASKRGLAHVLIGHTDDVEHVAESPDGQHVVTGSDDGTVRYWRLDDLTSTVMVGHVGPIETMTLSRDGKYLATAGTDHEVWLWELGTPNKRQLSGHGGTVRAVAFSPDGTQLASTSEDGTLYLWSVDTGKGRLLLRHDHGLRPLAWSRDGKTLLVGGYDGKIGRFDPLTGKGEMAKAHDAELRTIVVSPDGALIASGDEDGVALLWTAAGQRLRTLATHTDVVRDLVFTPDGKAVVSAGGDAHVWVTPLTEEPPHDLAGNHAGVKDIDVSADGRWVASAGIDGAVRVWPITGGEPRVLLGHATAVKGVAFLPDGRLVSGAEDDRARIWRLDEPAPPPVGAALRAWLDERTNLTVPAPRAP